MRADMADKAITSLASCPLISSCPLVYQLTQLTYVVDVDTGDAVCCAGTRDVGTHDVGSRDMGICVVGTHISAGTDDVLCCTRWYA